MKNKHWFSIYFIAVWAISALLIACDANDASGASSQKEKAGTKKTTQPITAVSERV